MIELQIESYCHECPEFEAETKKSYLSADGKIVAVECAFVCEHAQKCKYIKHFLEDRQCK